MPKTPDLVECAKDPAPSHHGECSPQHIGRLQGPDEREARLSLVVTTVGREADLARLLDSIDASPMASSVELVVVDQSSDGRCRRLVQQRPPPGPWSVGTSGRGASVGRNVGLEMARAQLIAFPNDNSWFDAATFSDAVAYFAEEPDVAGISGRLLTRTGTPSMLRWHRRPSRITTRNFMRTTICSTLVLRRSALDSVGGFDEQLGAGSAGWFGSGEESDLVLRLLDAGFRLEYRPDISIYHDDERDHPTKAFVAKMLKYGRGQGKIWRKHRLPVSHLLYLSLRKFAGAAVRSIRGQHILAQADIAYLAGTYTGWRKAALDASTHSRSVGHDARRH